MTLSTPRSDARLEARVTPDFKALVEKAASLSGYSSTKDFLIATMRPVAEEVVARHTKIHLTGDEGMAFIEALLNPPPANEALVRAMRLHDERVKA